VLRRHAQRDAGVADLPLRADEPLRERRFGEEEGACDLGRLEAADEAQRQRDLGLRRECRVAAGEDQFEAFVGDGRLLVVGKLLGACEQLRLARECLLAADPVDRRVPGRRDDPGARVRGRPVARPAFGGANEGVLPRIAIERARSSR
jgi:hypothetical protein